MFFASCDVTFMSLNVLWPQVCSYQSVPSDTKVRKILFTFIVCFYWAMEKRKWCFFIDIPCTFTRRWLWWLQFHTSAKQKVSKSISFLLFICNVGWQPFVRCSDNGVTSRVNARRWSLIHTELASMAHNPHICSIVTLCWIAIHNNFCRILQVPTVVTLQSMCYMTSLLTYCCRVVWVRWRTSFCASFTSSALWQLSLE